MFRTILYTLISDFGFTVTRENQTISVSGSPYKGQIKLMVEADFSSAAYFIVLGLLGSKFQGFEYMEGTEIVGYSTENQYDINKIVN